MSDLAEFGMMCYISYMVPFHSNDDEGITASTDLHPDHGLSVRTVVSQSKRSAILMLCCISKDPNEGTESTFYYYVYVYLFAACSCA